MKGPPADVLAYVFWHAPRPGVDLAQYAASLVEFHAALADDPPLCYVGSFTTRTGGLPWLGADAYEDWYVLAESAGLGALDRAAVDARRRRAHDGAAARAHVGYGGLYRLLDGRPIVPGASRWFGKPEDLRYADFSPTLDAVAAAGATLWQRMMSLGPAPEFCAQAASPVPLPAEAAGVEVDHERVAVAGFERRI